MSGDYVSTNDTPVVPFSDDESDDKALLTDEDSPSASPEERSKRAQKKQERITRLLDEGKQSKEEVSSLKAELAAVKAEQAEMRGYMTAQSHQRAPAQGKDPYQARLDAVYEKQSNAYQAAQAEVAAGKFDEKRAKYYERIAREVEEEKTEIHTERVIAQRMPAQRQEQAQEVWRQKYPDVYNNPKAYKYAEATFERRKALGDTVTHELVDEVMKEALTTFKLGPKPAPSQNERARMSGLPSSGGGGGGGNPAGGIPKTKEFMRMATALHSDLPEEEAFKKWVNGPGKALRAAKVI